MKGFKHTGRGPKMGHSFSPKAGFTHSGTNKQNVRGYTRSKPKYAHGGPVYSPQTSSSSALTRRTKPVTGFDKEAGGRGSLRPGFNKGGKACYAEGGKVGPLTAIAKRMKKGPSNEVKKFVREQARQEIAEGGPGSKDYMEHTKQFYKKGQMGKEEYSDEKMLHEQNLRLAKPPKSHKAAANKTKFAEGGKVATTGAAIKMMKELMKRGNSAEDAATKAARRYGVSKSEVAPKAGPTGGGGLPAEKQMLARGGRPMAGPRATVIPRPAPQGQKVPGGVAHHGVPFRGGYGSFNRKPIVGQ